MTTSIGDSVKSFEEDEWLVQECLLGNEKAWTSLISKYANLIFSIPLKRGFSQEDAADIFQSVCLTLLRELPTLRQPRALAAWLVRLTTHSCTRQRRRYAAGDVDEQTKAAAELPDELLQQLEREQMLRQAVSELEVECRQLVDLLFFTDPPVRYEAAATALGLATGSMGATRMRCLEKLRRSLEEKGFR